MNTVDNNANLYSFAAERDIILGAMMGTRNEAEQMVSQLVESDFYQWGNQQIFAIVKRRYHAHLPTEFRHVAEDILKEKDEALARVMWNLEHEDFLSAVTFPRSLKIVKDKARLRRIKNLCEDIGILTLSEDSERTMAELEERLLQLTSKETSENVSVTEAFTKLVETIDDRLNRFERGDAMPGVPVPIQSLANIIDSFRPGQLIIVAGRPGLGKSTLACNFVTHAAQHANTGVYFASLEMSDLELVEKIVCSGMRISSGLMRNGRMTRDQLADIQAYGNELGQWAPIWINQSPNQTVLKIRAEARKLVARGEIGMIVVDYLQLIESTGRYVNRAEAVASMSRQLKIMAKELNVPVIALSQLNRESESRVGAKPKVSDLRESGAIEQDADVILLIHKNEPVEQVVDANGKLKQEGKPGGYEIIVGKNRAGRTLSISVRFDGDLCIFEDLDNQAAAVFGGYDPGSDGY